MAEMERKAFLLLLVVQAAISSHLGSVRDFSARLPISESRDSCGDLRDPATATASATIDRDVQRHEEGERNTTRGARVVGGSEASPGTSRQSRIMRAPFSHHVHVIRRRESLNLTTFPPQGSHPWLARIVQRGHVKCMGFLIARRWVVTAAHCLVFSYEDGREWSSYEIIFGDVDRKYHEGTEQVRYIKEFKKHHSYVHSQTAPINDVAVIRLNKPVQLNNHIKILPLPPPGTVIYVESCVVAGWGNVGNGDSKPRRLKEASVSLATEDLCCRYWSGAYIPSSMLCTTSPDKTVDACKASRTEKFLPYFDNRIVYRFFPSFASALTDQSPEKCVPICRGLQGDSGSPLTCVTVNNSIRVAVGVVSFGELCSADSSIPMHGVYARVASYADWMRAALRQGDGDAAETLPVAAVSTASVRSSWTSCARLLILTCFFAS
ncbi:unnamed protein product [Darwinula stevensoni]|uniref:Peptidase S1 domain-containing protein n=1 Tax=Darwinula stevensoni TaxID=69355 RepID=A0A7R8X6B8_9CRUS|nr:unnamed protein product [Darwinula stevensoni]CAG0881290.1 unnamed protein product [Darwinula stevensoni]